jgi:hypothetical protein
MNRRINAKAFMLNKQWSRIKKPLGRDKVVIHGLSSFRIEAAQARTRAAAPSG